MQDLDTCIQQGIALLDAQCPGWYSRIDVEHLDMGSNDAGLLEQLYGSYVAGRKALGLTWAAHGANGSFLHGFDIEEQGDPTENRSAWEALTRAWQRALSEYAR